MLFKDANHEITVRKCGCSSLTQEPRIDSIEQAELLVEELRLNEERFRDFAESGSDWFFELDSELRFSFVSDQVKQVTGVAPDSVLGKSINDFSINNRLASESHLFSDNSARMLAREDWKDFTFTFVRDDGEHRRLTTSAKAFTDKNGDFAGYRGIGRDVTDQVKKENRLQSLAQIVEETINEIHVWDATTFRLLDANKSARENLGYTIDEMKHRLPKDFVQGINNESVKDLLGPLLDGSVDRQIIETAQIRKDGSTYPVRTQLQYMPLQTPPVFVAMAQDVSKLSQAENEAKQFAQIVETSLNEIYIFDAKTLKFIHVNFGTRHNMGYSYEEFCNMTPVDIKPEMTTGQFNRIVEPLRNGKEQRLVFETVHQRKDGSTYPVEVQLQLVQLATGSVFVAIIQDITERQYQTEALKLRDRAIAEVETGILITDAGQLDNPIIYANKAMERMTGYSMEEMLGRNPRFLQGDDRDQPGLKRIRAGIRDAVPVRETLNNYSKDGSRSIVEVTISPVRDEKGNVSHFIGAQSDLTEKFHTEERLRQSQKMEAIGQLTGGVAHDFNNLLTVVLGNCELLADRVRGDDFALDLLSEAIGATEAGASLTKQLLSFARQSPLQPQVLDLNDLVEGLSEMLVRSLGETVTLSKKLASDLGKTLADPGQTKSALLNLALNARDAMPDGGCLTIETKNIGIHDAEIIQSYGIEPGQYVRLTVSDNGMGMSVDTRSKAIDPFFTTKEQGKGTGLGLSMVHGFAKQSGGHLDIYSEFGHGTSVSLFLPVADTGKTECATSDEDGNADIGGRQTVLVVEDDARVRRITVARLEQLAYQVVETESGQEALDVLAERQDIDVVFTDMIMPGGMTGAELLVQVKALYPQIKQIITSGYAEDGAIPNGKTPFLRKPYSLTEMSKVFRELLG